MKKKTAAPKQEEQQDISDVIINVDISVCDIQMIAAGLQDSNLPCREAHRIIGLFQKSVNKHLEKKKEVKK